MYKEEMKKLQQSFYSKTLGIHIILMASRVLWPFLGIATWQKAYKSENLVTIPDLNLSFIENSELTVKVILGTLCVIGVLFDIIICKYRQYASILLYYELISTSCHAFLPLNFGDQRSLYVLLIVTWQFILSCCHMGPNIIFATFTITFIQLVPHPLVYSEDIKVGLVIGKLLNSIVLFGIVAIAGMVVTYIAQIRGKMSQLLNENLNLLNKMHEGIVVVSEKDRSLQFASLPAVRLLNQQPSNEDEFDKSIDE